MKANKSQGNERGYECEVEGARLKPLIDKCNDDKDCGEQGNEDPGHLGTTAAVAAEKTLDAILAFWNSRFMDGSDLEARLQALEARVAKLENAETRNPEATITPDDEGLWLVKALQDSPPAPTGSVILGGDVNLHGNYFSYQWQRPTDFVMNKSWSENLERISALAHPLRGEIMRRLLAAEASAADLVEEGVVTSTGTAYHHLSALHAAGWVVKNSDKWSVRTSRVSPLMTIIIAGEEH